MRRPSAFRHAHYWLLWNLGQLIVRLLWRFSVSGREKVPLHGGLLVAANHASYLDPPLVGLAVPRECHFLAKRELFHPRAWGAILRGLNAIPVERRELDPAVLRVVVGCLDRGGAVIMFPEGTRSRTGQLGAPRPGIGLFAREAQVPVLPALIEGSGGGWRARLGFRRIRVRFAHPIPPPGGRAGRQELSGYARSVMQAIAGLASTDPAGDLGTPGTTRGLMRRGN